MPVRPSEDELQRAHDSVRRTFPPLPVALARPALAATLSLGAAMNRKKAAGRIDVKRAAAGDRGED